MTSINFKPIFPSPLGYVNFGEANRDLNKRLIEDIETEMSESEGKTKTFRKNDMSWQSFPKMERKYSSFEELRLYISDSAKPILHESGVTYQAAYAHRTEGLWANVILGAGGYSRPHIHGHGRTLWSGVYYPNGLQGDENLDDFNEDDFKGLIEKLKVIREEQLIMENYNNIVRQGVDVEGIAEYGEDNLNRLKQTLNIMIEFFEDREDYEKCYDVKLFSDKINTIEF